MTPKEVLTIDIAEVKVLEVECSHCGAMFTLPLPKDNLPITVQCRGCEGFLWRDKNDTRRDALQQVVRSLSDWQQAKDKTFKVSFSITQQH